jgi:hypothetical protein
MSEQSVSDVRAYSKSTGFAKFLLVIIASHVHPKAVYAYPSLDTLARETTLSKPTVIKLIAALIALGELEVIRGHGRGHSNRYRITIAHEAIPDRPAEDDIDQPKGKAPSDHHPPAWSAEDHPDQPKGKPYLYLLPTPADMEKVNDPEEKVKSDPLKGKPSVDSKEVLRTSKEKIERGIFDLEKVKGQDLAADEPEYEYWYNHNPWHRRCRTHHLVGQPCPPVYGREEDELCPATS